MLFTLGKTWTQETRNLLDEGVGGQKGVVLASKLLDELLVLVELLQVIGGHGINSTVLRSVDIVLVTENAFVLSVLYAPPIVLVCRHTRWPCLGEGHGEA